MQANNDKAAPETAQDAVIGTLVADRYRVVRALGRGGMGTVYLAVHEQLRKQVALKILDGRGGRDKEIVARFEREAIASANLRHPNIAEASDFGRLPDGTLYLVMEYIDGKTAQAVLDASPAGLPADRVLHLLRQVAAALACAHAQDVVHRDLKPENIIVFDRNGERDVVKVIDFGIARIRNAMLGSGEKALTVAGTVFGTPEYMAPEQVMGQPADARADQYAFGVTAFELLTGRVPYTETDVSRLLMKHISAPIPRARDTAPHLPPAVNDVLAKLLGKRPDDRYPTIEQAFAALEASLTGASVSGPSVSAAPVSAPSVSAPSVSAPSVSGFASAVSIGPGPASFGPGAARPGAPTSAWRPPPSSDFGDAVRRGTARLAVTTRMLADATVDAAKKSPVVSAGVAFAGMLVLALVVILAGRLGGSSLPPEVVDALSDWKGGQYAKSGPALRTELGKNGALANDPEVVKVVAGAIVKPEGRGALKGMLDESRLGRSPVMAAALAETALGEVNAARNAALRLLRGRADLLAPEPRARVAYRDADDCDALRQALQDLAQAGTEPAKADLDSHRSGHCAEIVRREEICGCGPARAPSGRGKPSPRLR